MKVDINAVQSTHQELSETIYTIAGQMDFIVPALAGTASGVAVRIVVLFGTMGIIIYNTVKKS